MCRILTLLALVWLTGLISQAQPPEPETGGVFVQTDRSVYMAGEVICYTAFLHGNTRQVSRFAYLMVRDRMNRPVIGVRLEFDRRLAYGMIYLPDTLPSDVYQIVCYTNYMRNGPEVNFFHREILIANRFDKELSFLGHLPASKDTSLPSPVTGAVSPHQLVIQTDKNTYRPGEQIVLTLGMPGRDPVGVTRLSLSVHENPPGGEPEEGIQPFLLLPEGAMCYPAEVEAPVLQGRVAPYGTTSGSGTFTLLMSAPDTLANLQVITTDTLGVFCVAQNRFYDGKNLILKLHHALSARIQPDNKFDIQPSFVPSGMYHAPGMRNYLLRCADIVRVRKAYGLEERADTTAVRRASPSAPRVCYQPYHRIIPAEFAVLPDFAEIARNLVPALRVRRTRDGYRSDFLNPLTQSYFDEEPALFLDGVPIDEVNQIIRLGSGEISRIETFPVTRSFGSLLYPGILAVYTRNQAVRDIAMKTPAVWYTALQSEPFVRPVVPQSAESGDHNPDLRQVLLWNPDLSLDPGKEIRLFCQTSDLEGEYVISATGVTPTGEIVQGRYRITVKQP